jgi:hypothetical protein
MNQKKRDTTNETNELGVFIIFIILIVITQIVIWCVPGSDAYLKGFLTYLLLWVGVFVAYCVILCFLKLDALWKARRVSPTTGVLRQPSVRSKQSKATHVASPREAARHCPRCGAVVMACADVRFCDQCGSPLEKEEG